MCMDKGRGAIVYGHFPVPYGQRGKGLRQSCEAPFSTNLKGARERTKELPSRTGEDPVPTHPVQQDPDHRSVMTAAHRGSRMQCARRYVTRWTTTYPRLSDDERAELVDLLLHAGRQP